MIQKRECVCAYECGAFIFIEWEVLISERVLSGEIDFASHSYHKNKKKQVLHSLSAALYYFHAYKQSRCKGKVTNDDE